MKFQTVTKSPEELWNEVKKLTDHIHSTQSRHGNVLKGEHAESAALERQRASAQRNLSAAATEFMRQHGFTAGGKVRGKRRIPGL